ncbi:hypothetical protein MRB53_005345 [Persea americana]|uniref:Uncharacterized protein n=1 Tax=Persea americana TaxID=3435 RepID=A0ACC2MD43_PERAE|nr:hypothetical protein MRB53_005345 [Persea americana]
MSTNDSNVSSGPSSHASDDNYSNPFYLHPSDNPGNVLVSSLLDGDNYHTWSRAMHMALTVKNKLGLVDGSVKQPDASSPNLINFPANSSSISITKAKALNQIHERNASHELSFSVHK